jgi:hypothetical protein
MLRTLLLPLAGILLAVPAWADGVSRREVDPLAVPRGPVEIRDEWMLAQPRLTLPATTPDALGCGATELVLHLDWGNDFGFSQTGPGESPLADRRFLVDGEHRTLSLLARRGLGSGVDVGLRIPVQWRGAGILDGVIDLAHEAFHTLDNDRPQFDNDRYRVEGRNRFGETVRWADEGSGLGNAELSLRWNFLRDCRCSAPRLALIARLGIPTGTGPFRTDSWDAGLQLVGAKRLARRWDVYAGTGATWYSETSTDGFEYTPWRAYGFFVVEFRFARAWSLLLQTDASSRLISNIQDYPSYQWYAQLGVKGDLGGGYRLVVGFTENIIDQQSTLDFGGWMGIEKRL